MKHTTHQLSSVFVLTSKTHHTPAVISLCLDQWNIPHTSCHQSLSWPMKHTAHQWNTPHTSCHQSLSWPMKHTTHQLSSVFVLTNETHHTPDVISLCLDQWNTPHTRCHQSLSWPVKHITNQVSSVFVLTSKTHHTPWITLWGMIKVYGLDLTWLEPTFWIILYVVHLPQVQAKVASHYKPVKNKVQFVELSEPCSAN